MREVRLRWMAWLCAGLLGCVIGPNNGTAVDGAIVGRVFEFTGYVDEPGELITIQVMAAPGLDPSLPSSWIPFASASASTSPTTINSTDPLYAWSASGAPVANASQLSRWALGGVVRTRAVRASGAVLTTFDEPTYFNCVVDHYALGESWSSIGVACAGVSNTKSGQQRIAAGHVGLASTARTPLDLPVAQKPDWLGYKGDIAASETAEYYAGWGAPLTLAAFKSAYGFSPGSDVSATFYNNGDLGLGREMHCRAPIANTLVACYVTNYSGVAGQAVFGVDPNVVLGHAVSRTSSFATVAMVFDARVSAKVDFVVYDAVGNRVNSAKLDSVGSHQSVPNVCLTCHGINSFYDTTSNRIIGGGLPGDPAARFLAFDPYSYKFSTAAGFTLGAQQDAFRRLNQLVLQTRPTPATVDLIAGLYAPSSVNTVGALANDDYVPVGWKNADSSQDGNAMYIGAVKRACRMCHTSATSTSLDFLQLSDWTSRLARIRTLVCRKYASASDRGHGMPQAEHVSKMFWQSGARALIVSFTQSAHLPFPDPEASCDP